MEMFREHPEEIKPETEARSREALKAAVRPEFAEAELEEIPEAEGSEILKRVEVRGDLYLGKRLTPEKLQAEGLAPRYRVKIGDQFVWLASRPYDLSPLDAGYVGVVGYVAEGERVVARTFLRSNSQGVWRYLPAYATLYRESKNRMSIGRFGKGYGEESVALPFPLQRILSGLALQKEGLVQASNPEFIAVGTARELQFEELNLLVEFGDPQTPKDQLPAIADKLQESGVFRELEFVRDIRPTGRVLAGNFFKPRNPRTGKREKVRPDALAFSAGAEAPDFSRPIASWEQPSDLYRGSITTEVFPSRDGALHYLFFRDREGRAWIGGIEDPTQPVQSVGIRKRWIAGGDLLTPAFEYFAQAGEYGGIPRGKYVDMFEKYLSKVPVIQEYLASVTARGPADAGVPSPEAAVVVPPERAHGAVELPLPKQGETPREAPVARATEKPAQAIEQPASAQAERREAVRRVSLRGRLLEQKLRYMQNRITRLKELQKEQAAGKHVATPPNLKDLFDRGDALLAFMRSVGVKLESLDQLIPEATADKIINLFMKSQSPELGEGKKQ